MNRKLAFSIVGVIILVTASGCSGILGPGTTVSQVETGVSNDNVPYIAFNYTVQDYAKSLLEGPDGNIIGKRELAPESGRSAFRLPNPRPGTYTIAIQEGGNTKATKELEFDGPDAELVSLSGTWSGATLEQVQTEVRNSGDLPLQISSVAVAARGQRMTDSSMYTWLEPNESSYFSASNSYDQTITIEKAGMVTGDVTVTTSNETLRGTITEEFKPPSIKIDSVRQEWEKNGLIDVELKVRNTGDLPTEVNVSIRHSERTHSTGAESVQPHSATSFDFENEYLGDYPLFRAKSGGNMSVEIVADSPDGFASKTVYHKVQGATVDITNLSTSWNMGKLDTITYTVENSGEIEAESEVLATINGEEIVTDYISVDGKGEQIYEIAGGFTPLHSVTSGGDFTVKLEAKEYDVTAQERVEFDGPKPRISEIQASLDSMYDSDNVELDDVEFTLANRGDVSLSYDKVRVTLKGSSRSFSPYDPSLKPGASESISEYFYDPMSVPPGQYDLEVEIVADGKVTASKTVPVSGE